ncbi:MAG: heme-binding protein [Verrucomicrobiota bacterium]
MFRILTFITLLLAQSAISMAYEQMFSKTDVGTIEIKTLPEMRALKHTGETSDYFEENNGLFMPLFRYIEKNDLAMTVPVESEMAPATMMFFIGSEVDISEIESTEQIEVVTIPERQVLAVGIRGDYSEEKYQQALEQAMLWVQEHPDYVAAGPARMIYWNGPYVPGFLKRSELHLPIAKRS